MEIFISCCDGKLNETNINWDKKKSLSIVLCSKGYPGQYKKNLILDTLINYFNQKFTINNCKILFISCK